MARTAERRDLVRPARERLAAWLYTGPVGHLYSAVADIGVLWARWLGARARARLRAAWLNRSGT